MFVNKNWMKVLNLEDPKTTDDLYGMLKAFKEKDPNGNGIADEVPLTTCADSWHGYIDGFVMCSFIYSDGKDKLRLVDGKVDPVFNKPEYKEGLRFLNKLYTEGLIDKDAFSQKLDQEKQKCNQTPTIIGSVLDGSAVDFTGVTSPYYKDYGTIAPVKGPNGVQTTFYDPFHMQAGQFTITKNCKNPEIAFQWADWLYSPDAMMRYVEIGVEGVDWRKAQPGELGIDGKQATYVYTPRDYKQGEIQNVTYFQVGPSFRPWDYYLSRAAGQDLYAPDNFEALHYYETKTNYDGYQPKLDQIFPPLVYSTKEDGDVLSQVKTAVNDYVKESVARFITGDLNVDKDWDAYLKNLDNAGLQKYLEILQRSYDAQYKK